MSHSLDALRSNLATAGRRKLMLLLAAVLKFDLATATECWTPTFESRRQGGQSLSDPLIFLWEIAAHLGNAADDPKDVSQRTLLKRLWDEVKELAIQEQDFEAAVLVRDQQDQVRNESSNWLSSQVKLACDGTVSRIELMHPVEVSVKLRQAARTERDKEICHLIREIWPLEVERVDLDPRWRTSDVVGLARAIYDDRAFERMPILADALMDAGCENEEIIGHCRGAGPHVRGCWVVDLILDKK